MKVLHSARKVIYLKVYIWFAKIMALEMLVVCITCVTYHMKVMVGIFLSAAFYVEYDMNRYLWLKCFLQAHVC